MFKETCMLNNKEDRFMASTILCDPLSLLFSLFWGHNAEKKITPSTVLFLYE